MTTRISDPEELGNLLEPFAGRRLNGMDYSLQGTGARGTVLLIAGLSMHRTEWSPELLAALQARGYATLCVDNRDAGLTETDGPADAAYSLAQLAQDLVGLVRGLELPAVHVVGMSMGGMIAQHVALEVPELVASLTSLMSTTSARGVGRPHDQSKWIFTTDAPTDDFDEFVEYALRYHQSITGPTFTDTQRAQFNARIVWERGVDPSGTRRQLAAIRADGDRTERLAAIVAPTLVIHGTADPMIDISGGLATAQAIPGSRFVPVENMGHAVTWELADPIAGTLDEHFTAAARRAG